MLDRDTLRNQIISRRTFMIGAGKLGFIFLLASRMFYMQFLKKDEYKTLSDKNRIRIVAIPPIRGQILDRNNVVLAKNKTCFKLLLDKNGNPEYPQEIELIATLLELDDEQQYELQKKVRKAGNRIPAVIIDSLEWKDLSSVEELKTDFKSVFVDTGYNRYYPQGSECAHLLGYLGKSEDKTIIDESFKVGKTGLENFYEEHLRGSFGHKQLEVNAFGRYVRSLATSESVPGKDLNLNIDSRLQKAVSDNLNPQGASAVLMNCKTGAVYCFNSSPSFDPNNFNFLSNKYWNELNTNQYKPLINKITQSLYPPGSVFKIITVLAALEAGHDPNEHITCTGAPALGGNSFRCSSRTGHGSLTLDQALKYSCNTYMFAIARKIGADRIINMAKKFGLGEKSNIDLPGEKNGFVPTREWKKSKTGNIWTIGDTLNLSIGQGFLLVTPIQLARLVAAIANNGKLLTPRIVVNEPEFSQIDVNLEHLEYVKSSMYKAVNEIGGTAYFCRINHNGAKMAGKTGTAQVIAKKSAADDLSRSNIAWQRRNHAIFFGYAPYDNPEYAVCVYYDHGGGGGSAAAPIAKKIIEFALENDI